MPHKTFRAAATATTFIVGLAAVWLSGILPSLETRLADWLVPDAEVTATPPDRLVTREEWDEQEVYATVVREMFGGDGPRVVISSEIEGYPACGEQHAAPAVFLQYMGASAETLRDYCRVRPTKRFSKLPNLSAEQVLFDEEEHEKIFRNGGDGWKRFYEKYPGSSGYVDFYAIGFNGARDEALLDATQSCGWVCGDSWYVLLRKGPDGWHIQKKLKN